MKTKYSYRIDSVRTNDGSTPQTFDQNLNNAIMHAIAQMDEFVPEQTTITEIATNKIVGYWVHGEPMAVSCCP